jgi:hypothetical protein
VVKKFNFFHKEYYQNALEHKSVIELADTVLCFCDLQDVRNCLFISVVMFLVKVKQSHNTLMEAQGGEKV